MYYDIEVCGVKRKLPLVKLSEDLTIASFVLLGDQEMTTEASKAINERLPAFDLLVTAEAKGIPLVHELAKLNHQARYVVARKSRKAYMDDPFYVELESITTKGSQKLYLDQEDRERIRGARVAIVDDVVSTGDSIRALETLVEEAGGQVVCKACILAEGEAANRKDIIYLDKLPLF